MEKFEDIPIKKIQSLENIRMRISEKDVAELMQNIKQNGLLQPIGVWETEAGEYVIAFGNRRLIACEKLGWKTITAKIMGELNYEELLIVNTSENLHREDVTVAELGRIVNLLHEKGLALSEIAIRLGLSSKKISIAIKLFKRIAPKHRKDVVFMKPGTMHKMGKVPASSYNYLFSVRNECRMSDSDFNKIIGVVKKEDLSLGQIRLLGVLLIGGATLEKAMKVLDKYNVRRINLPINKEVEKALMKKYNIKAVYSLFKKILGGEIEGAATLVFK